MRGLKVQAHVAFADEEILRLMDGAQPNIVPVDAPPTLPPGRTTIHDRAGGHVQECDRELWQLGIRDGDSYDL